jgi:outer membrane protein assembly factor BamB
MTSTAQIKDNLMSKLITTLLLIVIGTPGKGAENTLPWPRFRGPNGSGVAAAEKPPVDLGPEKNVKWRVPVPSGLSSPIIVGDKLVLTAVDHGELYTIAYSRMNGAEAWRARAPASQLEAHHETEGSPAASTSATDGERIVSYFGSCGLCCYDLRGKELWKIEMPPALTLGSYGSGVSPIIADKTVVLLRDEASDPRIIAVDITTGKVKWQQPRTSRGGFSTPVVWETAAGKQIAAAGHYKLIGYDLQSGQEKWFVKGMPTASCASPMVFDDKLYFAAWSPGAADELAIKPPPFDLLLLGDTNNDGAISKDETSAEVIKGFFNSIDTNKDGKITRSEWNEALALVAAAKNSAFALQPGGKGDVTETNVRWRKAAGLPYVSSAIVYRGQLVMVKDGGIVTAYDAASGDQVYQKRIAAPGKYFASPVAANGYIYFSSLDDGTITVLKAGAASPEVVAKNPPLGERIGATPAIADNALYVRTAKYLYAFSEN